MIKANKTRKRNIKYETKTILIAKRVRIILQTNRRRTTKTRAWNERTRVQHQRSRLPYPFARSNAKISSLEKTDGRAYCFRLVSKLVSHLFLPRGKECLEVKHCLFDNKARRPSCSAGSHGFGTLCRTKLRLALHSKLMLITSTSTRSVENTRLISIADPEQKKTEQCRRGVRLHG